MLFGPFALAYLVMAVMYATTPVYIDHGESTLTVGAQQWLQGRPLYHAADSPYLYSVFQGPLAYLWAALALTIYPDPIMASKLAGGFWSISSFVLVFLIFWRSGGFWIAIPSLGLVAGELMLDSLAPFWDRPDPLLIFSVSLGLGALVLRNKRYGAAILVLALAMAINCRIHGPFYLLPGLAIWCRRHGWLENLVVVVLGSALSFIPFLLPGISLQNYFFWLQLGAHQERSLDVFYENIETLLQMILPLIFFMGHPRLKFRWRDATEETVLFYSLILAGVLVAIPASKLGSGWHHLLPLAVYVGYLFCLFLADLPDRLNYRWTLLVVMIWSFFCYQKLYSNVSFVAWYCQNVPYREMQVELRAILRVYPAAKTQMGVGHDRDYAATYYAPWIYREGTPCVANTNICMDLKEAGLSLQALKTSLETEQFAYWLIPHDGAPFTMRSWFDYQPLFDDSIRQTFAQHYVLDKRTRFYDIYRAKTAAPP